MTTASVEPVEYRGILEFVVEDVGVAPPRALVLAVHGFNETGGALRADITALGVPVRVVHAYAARPISPRAHAVSEVAGYLWYFTGDGGLIEPVLFGDNLRQLEALLLDMVEQQRPTLTTTTTTTTAPVWLVGRDQGAVLSLALAGIWPELISGVVLKDLPRWWVADWTPPTSSRAGQRVVLVNAADVDGAAGALRALAADVRVCAGDVDDGVWLMA